MLSRSLVPDRPDDGHRAVGWRRQAPGAGRSSGCAAGCGGAAAARRAAAGAATGAAASCGGLGGGVVVVVVLVLAGDRVLELAHPVPSCLPSPGSRLGPKISSTITRTIPSSRGPMGIVGSVPPAEAGTPVWTRPRQPVVNVV